MLKKEKRIPLKKMLQFEGNIYEFVNASIHRAEQITKAGSEDLETYAGKIVSLAIDEVITKKVEYRKK